MAYTVLMVDIRKSRQYQQRERQELQDFCLKTVDLLNRIFSEALVKNVEFSAGDELQGLFKRMDVVFLYLRLLRMLLWNKEIYAGIGHGDWTVQVERRGTTFQDGPVYHHAREALEACKKAKDYSVVVCTDAGLDGVSSALLNSLFSLNERLTRYQNELWLLLEILWPVGDPLMLNESHIRDMVDLLNDKNTLAIFNKGTQRSIFRTIKGNGMFIRPARKRKDDVLMPGHLHGAVSTLTELTGLQQQSIDKALRNSNIFVERNTAFALVEYLQRELKGGNE
ncbi:MAG: hypothetical protein J6W23_13500 [Victivallales bacterium]|nr:hypothetical protein [Victivallales bacterium]